MPSKSSKKGGAPPNIKPSSSFNPPARRSPPLPQMPPQTYNPGAVQNKTSCGSASMKRSSSTIKAKNKICSEELKAPKRKKRKTARGTPSIPLILSTISRSRTLLKQVLQPRSLQPHLAPRSPAPKSPLHHQPSTSRAPYPHAHSKSPRSQVAIIISSEFKSNQSPLPHLLKQNHRPRRPGQLPMEVLVSKSAYARS
jgi:hypothetical protein